MESRQPVLYRVLLAAMTDSDKSYLAYMAVRMLEMHRILKPTGTIYLHCDPTMSHYLKLLLDAVFGKQRFRNEVIWSYRSGGGSKRHFGRKHDVLLLYTKSNTWTFNADDVRIPYDAVIAKSREHLFNEKGKVLGDVWDISRPPNHAKEWVGYPTQKPLSLLQRIVTASSNPGDIVFDPFCGCATTLVAADDLQRSWVGIDISEKAADLVMERIEDRQGLFRDIVHRSDILQRTDLGQIPAYNSTANRKHLYGEQGGDCAACSTHFAAQHLEVDHIIAVAKGGTHHLSNLQLLCGHCNRVKGDRGMAYLRSKLQMAA